MSRLNSPNQTLTMPSGNTITNAPFDVDSNGAIQLTTALNLDYETLVNANEEIRCNNTGNTMDGSIDPVNGVCRVHDQKNGKQMVNRISILRHGGAQRLCSMNGWRLATKSELTSAWNTGLKKIETFDNTVGTQPNAPHKAWSYEGECIFMTESNSPQSGSCPVAICMLPSVIPEVTLAKAR